MDWLRKIPLGQYVAGNIGWLRRIDPRLKMLWVLLFLLSPVLAGEIWRIALVVALFVITFCSRLPIRIWWRSFLLLILLGLIVGALSLFLPTGETSGVLAVRSPQELPNAETIGQSWQILQIGSIGFGNISIGPFIIDRRSAELGLKTSTLVFTVVHSVNLMLVTTSPEDLMWTISWFLSPLKVFGVPVERMSFQLLLALRFLPLVQEEFQNLLRSMATRSVNIQKLGFKQFFALILSVGERFFANILLRAQQGADSLMARGGVWVNPERLRPLSFENEKVSLLNIGSSLLLCLAITLRWKYGTL